MERRVFLKKSLTFGLGILTGLGVGKSSLAIPKKAEDELPYSYVKLDSKKIGKRAYRYYWKRHCAYAVFASILEELKKKVGGAYTYIPTGLYNYGKSGIVGWGTVCGALNGACGIITLTCKEYKDVIDTLFNWYCKEKLPKFIPYGMEAYPKSTSNSPLCHISVMKWCNAASDYFGKKINANSKERSERCARLSADVAMKTVELLNKYHEKKLVPIRLKSIFKTKMNCSVCHE